MKKVLLTMLLVSSFAIAEKANAQVSVNIGLQPAWGPVGYQYVDYYYIPDIETYYYVPSRQFIYLNNGQWIYSSALPVRYRTYNLYNGYKVVVNQPKPYLRHATYKVKYAKYKGASGKQKAIKYSNAGGNKNGVVKGNSGKGSGKAKGKNKHL